MKLRGRELIVVICVIGILCVASIGAIRTQAHRLVFSPLTYPIAANLGGAPDLIAEYTIATPDKSSAFINCLDASPGGCDLFIAETGAQNGQVLRLVNISANAVLIREAAGVLEMSGDFTAGQWDTIEFQYITDRWVEQSEHDN